MAKALVLIAPGFEEIEAITIIDLLRRAEIEVTAAGIQKGMIDGSHKITILPDVFYLDINPDDFDILILPGGQPGTKNLMNDENVIEWLRERNKNGGMMAAICAAPLVFHKAGLTGELKITSYPSEKNIFSDSDYKEDAVVKDKNIITSRGVGTAIDFSLKLIEELTDIATAKDIKIKILHQ